MKKTSLIVRILLVPLDYLAVFLAGLSAHTLRFGGLITDYRPVVFEISLREYLGIVAWVAAAAIVIFFVGGLYNLRVHRRFLDEAIKIFYACATVVLAIIVLIFFQRELFSSRFIILSGWALGFFYVLGMHTLVRLTERGLYRRGVGADRVLAVGNAGDTEALLTYCYHHPSTGYRIVARLRDLSGDFLNATRRLLETKDIDTVLQADATLPREQIWQLQELCDEYHVDFLYAPDRFTQQATNISMREIGGYPLLEIRRTPLEGWGRIVKRLVDIVGALVLIILVSPLYLLLALLIKLDSHGPVFFGRLDDGEPLYRIGRHGQPFRYIKFRTMRPGVHNLKRSAELAQRNLRKDGPLTKIKDDPRVTRVGYWLRRFSLDELTEFLLVLRGTMSLVGPRPHEPEEVALYTPQQRKVLHIKPGITGLAQVSGRSDLSFNEEVALDLFYIERWSLGLDLQLLLRTPLAVLKRRSAA